jgi:hypothetical protein
MRAGVSLRNGIGALVVAWACACGGSDEGALTGGPGPDAAVEASTGGIEDASAADVGGATSGGSGGSSGSSGSSEAGAGRDAGSAGGAGGAAGSGGTLPGDASQPGDSSPLPAGCDPVPPPILGDCPAECNGGCAGGVCRILCGGIGGCSLIVPPCPTDMPCEVTCSETSCTLTSVTCPPEQPCNVVCAGGGSACTTLTVQCGSGPCNLHCGPGTCTGAIVNCGTNVCRATCDASFPPAVACGMSCDCQGC